MTSRSLTTLYRVDMDITAPSHLGRNGDWSLYWDEPLSVNDFGYHGDAYFPSKAKANQFIAMMRQNRRRDFLDLKSQIDERWGDEPNRPRMRSFELGFNDAHWMLVYPPPDDEEVEPWVIPAISLVQSEKHGHQLYVEMKVSSETEQRNLDRRNMTLKNSQQRRVEQDIWDKRIDWITKPQECKIQHKEHLCEILTRGVRGVEGDMNESDETATEDDPQFLDQYYETLY